MIVILFVFVVVVGALLTVRWSWRQTTLSRVTRHGLELLTEANTPLRISAALDEWEQQTARSWHDRRDDLVEHLFSDCDLSDRRIRLLLTRVAGADYGDRREDWEKWYETHARLRQGEQPQVSNKQRVRLKPLWESPAPVGLTAWFSTIIPLDGQIYVASLGTSFGDEHDTADGIVCVDGKSGQAKLLFQPTEGRVRDVLGIAAGDDCLFAACRNGFVYCVEPDGRLRWKTGVGAPPIGPPLSIDLNQGGISDVITVTSQHKVVAISGRTGKTVWVSQTPERRNDSNTSESAVGATLAVGPVTERDQHELVVTTADGSIRVLATRTGRLHWEGTLNSGSLSGAIVCAEQTDDGPPAFVADRDTRIWSLVRSDRGLETVTSWDLLLRPDEGLIAGLRTLTTEGHLPTLIACPTGSYFSQSASVCALDPGVVRWRYSPGGTIWATPALADINADGETELIITSIDAKGPEHAVGVITVLSAHGHCLLRQVMPAPIECSPVVADVDGDNRLEILVADRAGRLHCFATNCIGPVEWALFGGDSHNTRNKKNAYSFGQSPVGTQWRWKPD